MTTHLRGLLGRSDPLVRLRARQRLVVGERGHVDQLERDRCAASVRVRATQELG